MQLEWLQSFIEIVRTKSLSKAGERLNISQTALSKQVRSLEETFGVRLFHRSTTGMDLTPEGQLLVEKAQVWLTDFEETKRQLQNAASAKHIILGSLPSLAAHYLPEKLLRMRADDIRVDLKVFHTSLETLEAFQNGEIDVAIVDRNIPVSKLYFRKDLFTEPYYAVLPKTHPLAQHSGLEVSDVTGEPLVLYPPACDVRQSVVKSFAKRGVSPRVAGEVPFGESILGFVAAGAGMTVVPEIIAKHLSQSSLVHILLTDFGEDRTVSFVAKSEDLFQALKLYFRAKVQ